MRSVLASSAAGVGAMSAPGASQARGSLVRPLRTGPSLASRARLLVLCVLAALMFCAPQREGAAGRDPPVERGATERTP
jgi:hypothetical protein